MTTAISSEGLVDRIMDAGIPDRAAAQLALRAVLATLGQRLTDDEAHALASNLSGELARLVDRGDYDCDFDAAEFYERMRRRERTSPGTAREHADVVLRAVGEALGEELRQRTARRLPDAIARRLLPPEVGEPPPHAAAIHAPKMSTLAHGRPGSRRPLSEAAPPEGHSGSVARSDEPHAETKLSSGHGLTQERLGETLATGRPPQPKRPISEADDE